MEQKTEEKTETAPVSSTKGELFKLIKTIKDNQDLVDADLTEWDWRTRPALEISKSEAKRTLVGLKGQYLKEFTKLTSKVFIDGTPEQVSSFTTLLTKEGANVFTAPNIYEFLADNTAPKLSYGNVFSTAAWMRLTEILADTCRTFDVYPHTPPVEPVNTAIYSKDDLVDVIKDVVRNAFGDTLNKVYLTSNFLNNALVNKFDKNMAIMVVSGLSENEKASLMDTLFPGQPSFSLSMAAEEVPDKSTALKVYRRVHETFIKAAKGKKAAETTKVESHQ